MDMKSYMAALEKQTTDFLNHHGMFVRNVLGWGEGDRGLVANGKVSGPLKWYWKQNNNTENYVAENLCIVLEKQKVVKFGSPFW